MRWVEIGLDDDRFNNDFDNDFDDDFDDRDEEDEREWDFYYYARRRQEESTLSEKSEESLQNPSDEDWPCQCIFGIIIIVIFVLILIYFSNTMEHNFLDLGAIIGSCLKFLK